MVLLDAAGRRRSPATIPGRLAGRAPRKGDAVPARSAAPGGDHPRHASGRHDRHGLRLRALIAVLWRGGLRISEALALNETDIDAVRGSSLIRHGKGDKRREAGMDQFGFEQLAAWLAHRVSLPVGPLFCVIGGPTRGRRWAATAARAELRHFAAAQLLERLRSAASGGAGEIETRRRRQIVLHLTRTLQVMAEQIRELETEIADQLDTHPDGEIFRSFFRSRDSVICAATLLAEIGDCRVRYPHRDAIAAQASQAPVAVESGKRKTAKFRWACNKRLRNAIATLAHTTRRWIPGPLTATTQPEREDTTTAALYVPSVAHGAESSGAAGKPTPRTTPLDTPAYNNTSPSPSTPRQAPGPTLQPPTEWLAPQLRLDTGRLSADFGHELSSEWQTDQARSLSAPRYRPRRLLAMSIRRLRPATAPERAPRGTVNDGHEERTPFQRHGCPHGR